MKPMGMPLVEFDGDEDVFCNLELDREDLAVLITALENLAHSYDVRMAARRARGWKVEELLPFRARKALVLALREQLMTAYSHAFDAFLTSSPSPGCRLPKDQPGR